jgi:hypothetical protein
MKKAFRYIENTWTGDDKKPSIKRILAISLCIHMMISISSALRSYVHLIELAYSKYDTIPSDLVSAAGAGLANVSVVLGIEAGLIAALLSLASYQSLKADEKV